MMLRRGSSFVSVLHLVRHASAGDRHAWRGDDSERPLDPKGHAQAAAIARALADARIGRVLSSCSVRCVQTVEPLAVATGLHIELADELFEGAHGMRTEALIDELAGGDCAAVLCSHGDVIPEVLWRLAYRGVDVDGLGRCKKASIWELHVRDGVVTHGTYRAPRTFGAGARDVT